MRHILTHITAHQCALKAGILHRNLSLGNMMIIENEEANISGGMLIDWDLSKFVNTQDEPNIARQHTRTVSQVSEPLYLLSPDVHCHQGTWQFMAGDLVHNHGISQTFLHDLESAFWVLLFMTLSYIKTTYTTKHRSILLKQTMSPININGCGGVDKINFMANKKALIGLEMPDNPKVTVVLRFLHLKLGEQYRQQDDPGLMEASSLASPTPTLDNSTLNVTNSSTDKDMVDQKPDEVYEGIFKGLRNALHDPSWSESDPAASQTILLSAKELQAAHLGMKRSRSVAEQLGVFVQQPGAKQTEIT
jgi:Fungal protein kinase